MASLSSKNVNANDRLKYVKEFEERKLGVKGLVDSGITRIPSIFRHPPETLVNLANPGSNPGSDPIPVIDLSGPPPEVVDQVSDAARKFGFFQVINHGVPIGFLDRLLEAIKAFHELPDQERMRYYRRDTDDLIGVKYYSNVDLYHTKAAGWRDTLQLRLGPTMPDFDAIPAVCRNEVIEWNRELQQLGEKLLGLFSQGLGLNANKLFEMSCLGTRDMVGQYYPHCPEPDQTVGLKPHTDPDVFTVLLQDQAGGLQVNHDGNWVDVKPVHGALVINVGDLLQIMSNNKYKSVEHRVYANPRIEPRVSLAVLIGPGMKDNLYGALEEIVSAEEPALYRKFTYTEFMSRFFTKEFGAKSLVKFFSLENS